MTNLTYYIIQVHCTQNSARVLKYVPGLRTNLAWKHCVSIDRNMDMTQHG